MARKVYQILKYHANYELIDVFNIADSLKSLIKQQIMAGTQHEKSVCLQLSLKHNRPCSAPS